jgi:hypothetical protein
MSEYVCPICRLECKSGRGLANHNDARERGTSQLQCRAHPGNKFGLVLCGQLFGSPCDHRVHLQQCAEIVAAELAQVSSSSTQQQQQQKRSIADVEAHAGDGFGGFGDNDADTGSGVGGGDDDADGGVVDEEFVAGLPKLPAQSDDANSDVLWECVRKCDAFLTRFGGTGAALDACENEFFDVITSVVARVQTGRDFLVPKSSQQFRKLRFAMPAAGRQPEHVDRCSLWKLGTDNATFALFRLRSAVERLLRRSIEGDWLLRPRAERTSTTYGEMFHGDACTTIVDDVLKVREGAVEGDEVCVILPWTDGALPGGLGTKAADHIFYITLANIKNDKRVLTGALEPVGYLPIIDTTQMAAAEVPINKARAYQSTVAHVLGSGDLLNPRYWHTRSTDVQFVDGVDGAVVAELLQGDEPVFFANSLKYKRGDEIDECVYACTDGARRSGDYVRVYELDADGMITTVVGRLLLVWSRSRDVDELGYQIAVDEFGVVDVKNAPENCTDDVSSLFCAAAAAECALFAPLRRIKTAVLRDVLCVERVPLFKASLEKPYFFFNKWIYARQRGYGAEVFRSEIDANTDADDNQPLYRGLPQVASLAE